MIFKIDTCPPGGDYGHELMNGSSSWDGSVFRYVRSGPYVPPLSLVIGTAIGTREFVSAYDRMEGWTLFAYAVTPGKVYRANWREWGDRWRYPSDLQPDLEEPEDYHELPEDAETRAACPELFVLDFKLSESPPKYGGFFRRFPMGRIFCTQKEKDWFENEFNSDGLYHFVEVE
ncbi:MAG: hypothetical protein AB7O52_17095 [Planctomycetota bacterium]